MSPTPGNPPTTCDAGGVRWRLRWAGNGGPRLLLVHGTGSSGASWAGVAQRLAGEATLLMPDLPGHGGSSGFADHRATLPRMAEALAALLEALGIAPVLAVGHSAGAAVVLQMAVRQRLPAARRLVGLNAALAPLPGLAATVFPPLARLIAAVPGLPQVAAARASRPASLQRLIASTGSRLAPDGIEHYRALLTRPGHVRGALDMMAHWDLRPLRAALPALATPLWLVAGSADGTVPCTQSRALAAALPAARYVGLPGLGHLAHEEAPETVAALLREALAAG